MKNINESTEKHKRNVNVSLIGEYLFVKYSHKTDLVTMSEIIGVSHDNCSCITINSSHETYQIYCEGYNTITLGYIPSSFVTLDIFQELNVILEKYYSKKYNVPISNVKAEIKENK